ncbi:hypothetical protein LOCC1_G006915 [Lachnellula occidentalis]|uniref:Uncharacterized protein n=1 Tax=Lachnellula occidentalis TaxID=215460 RepID=A0A8H8RMW7_9HELO|nr:hypothetical protein LOCC1_G006915 [Lachnellula occidentalis]
MTTFTRPPKPHYLSYRIARGEQGVLTYEPYKSHLLPHWRFRTPQIARTSAETLYQHFLSFYEQQDFVGMDMARKFIQMGMTRAKRYANYEGGRKYMYAAGEEGKESVKVKVQREKSEGHVGKEGKEEASGVFRGYWGRCREHEGYQRLKREFLKEQKEWEDLEKRKVKVKEDEVKIEDDSDDEVKIKEEEVKQPVKKKRKTKA